MKALRFGIVGCGGISYLHAECLKKLEAQGLATLIAGAEIHEGRRKAFGEKWGVATHDSLASMLKRDDIDVVTITTPSGLHGEHCMEVAASGRHILCEKPLDTKLAQADAAIAAAKKYRVTLGAIFQQRFAPGPMKVKRAIDGGYFGKIIFAHAETPWYRTQEYYDSGDWRGTWDLDGGVLSNQSPHMIDRLLWLGGDLEEVISATCCAGLDRDIEAETLAVATLRLQGGALASLTGTTLAYDGLPQRVLICGTEGNAAFSGDDLVAFKTKVPFEAGESEGPAAVASASSPGKQASDPLALAGDGHLGNIKDFVLAIQNGRKPFVVGEDARKVTRALNMIYQKAGVGPYANQRIAQ